MTDLAPPAQSPPRRWPATVSSAAAAWVGHGLLWALVVGGVSAGVLALVLHAEAATRLPPPVRMPASSVGAEGFAELYVAAWLGQAGRGSEEALTPYYRGQANLGEVPPGAMYVLRTATVGVEQPTDDYWAVTVAADVLTAGEGGWQPGGVRYYSVGVAATDQGLAATSLPSQVPAPPSEGPAPRLAVAQMSSAGDDPQTEATQRFLAALLAGQGELDRYTAPGSGLRPIDPPPFTVVELQRIGTQRLPDGTVAVRAEVAAVDRGGLTQVLHYSLELAQRERRWEVVVLHPAPPLAEVSDRQAQQ